MGKSFQGLALDAELSESVRTRYATSWTSQVGTLVRRMRRTEVQGLFGRDQIIVNLGLILVACLLWF